MTTWREIRDHYVTTENEAEIETIAEAMLAEVRALGGQLEVVANFGDERLVLG